MPICLCRYTNCTRTSKQQFIFKLPRGPCGLKGNHALKSSSAPSSRWQLLLSPTSCRCPFHHGAHRYDPPLGTAHPAAAHRPMRFACGHGATTRHERRIRVCFLFFAGCPWVALGHRVERGARPLYERPKTFRDGEAQAHVRRRCTAHSTSHRARWIDR